MQIKSSTFKMKVMKISHRNWIYKMFHNCHNSVKKKQFKSFKYLFVPAGAAGILNTKYKKIFEY